MAIPFISMAVFDILQTFKFFLNKVKDWKSNKMEFNYNLFGFFVSTASIPDYLFHYYYVRYFKPKEIAKDRFEPLKMNDYIDECMFRREARKTENQEALRFINFWEKEKKKLRNDPNIKTLHKIRNASIHHKLAVKPTFEASRPYAREITHFGWKDKDEDIDIPDGVEFCKYCYDKMNEFVDHVRSNF